MTACKDCLFSREKCGDRYIQHYCIAKEEDAFDYWSGEIKKESDILKYIPDNSTILCIVKNKGDCTDFKPNSEVRTKPIYEPQSETRGLRKGTST